MVMHFQIGVDHAACGEVLAREEIELRDGAFSATWKPVAGRKATDDLSKVTCPECKAALAVTQLVKVRPAPPAASPEPAMTPAAE